MDYAPAPQSSYPYGAAPTGYPPYGAPGGYYPAAAPTGTNGLAIASLVCGIIGGFACILWIPAIIMGFVALNQIKATGDRQPGRGLAIAGIVLGFLWVVLLVVYIVAIMSLGTTNNY